MTSPDTEALLVAARERQTVEGVTLYDRTLIRELATTIAEQAKEIERQARNIEMWKGQVERQSAELTRLHGVERHLAEARAERDALRTYAHDATVAITGLTVGGSEYFGKRIGEMYTADLPFCVERIRERRGYKMDAMRATARAEAAEKEVERKDAALRRIAEGNLGDASWQADYDKIREVALAALGERP